MKKEIIIGQNRSSSLQTILHYFSNEQYAIRIAPNFDAVVRLESEKQSDYLILSTQLLPKTITPTLSRLQALSPQSQLILTHTDGLLIKKQLAGLFPSIQMFDSHLDNELPEEMIKLFEAKDKRPTLGAFLSDYIPNKTALTQLVPSWLMF